MRTFDDLRASHDAVVVGGLSMGGALVLRLAADRGDEPAGVMVVDPAVATRRRDVRLLPVLEHLVPCPPSPPSPGDVERPGVAEGVA